MLAFDQQLDVSLLLIRWPLDSRRLRLLDHLLNFEIQIISLWLLFATEALRCSSNSLVAMGRRTLDLKVLEIGFHLGFRLRVNRVDLRQIEADV